MSPACGRRISFRPDGAPSSTGRPTLRSSRAAWGPSLQTTGDGRVLGTVMALVVGLCRLAGCHRFSLLRGGTGVPNTILINRLFRRIHSSTGSSVVSTIYVPLRFHPSLALSVRCANAHRQRSGSNFASSRSMQLCFWRSWGPHSTEESRFGTLTQQRKAYLFGTYGEA